MKVFKKKRQLGKLLLGCIISLSITSTNSLGYAMENSEVIIENDIMEEMVEYEKIYNEDGYNICYTVDNVWENGYNMSVTIENISEEAIENWMLQVDLSDKIVNIWNAEIIEENEGTYIIRNARWNQDIYSHASVTFGISVEGTFEKFPINGIVPCVNIETKAEGYDISYSIGENWEAGFIAFITITNTGNQMIEDWFLEMDYENEIDMISNAAVSEKDGKHYVLKNAGYNQNIMEGESVVITFNVLEGKIDNIVQNIQLKQYSREERKAESQGEIIYSESSYYKSIVEEDIAYDEDSGIYYVKNQFLVSALFGLPYDAMEILTEEVQGEIVGYIPTTNDYQIELREDVDYATLKNIMDFVDGFSYIDSVSLNTVIYSEDDVKINDGEYKGEKWDEASPSGKNWGLEALHMLSAWDNLGSVDKVNIGVIDSGFDTSHEDLVFTKTWENKKEKHGTAVAGVLAATRNNEIGIAGVMTNKNLYGYRISGYGSAAQYKTAINTLIEKNVRVINVSKNSGHEACYAASHGNEKAVNYIEESAKIIGTYLQRLIDTGHDFVIVTSAGNVNKTFFEKADKEPYGVKENENEEGESGNALAYYNSFLNAITQKGVKSRIITVGSIGQSYKYSDFSNIGNRVDVVAPGEDIMTCGVNSTYINTGGTSFSAPYIAGIAGLLYGVNKSLTGVDIKNIIKSNITNVDGYGLVDANRCVLQAKTLAETKPSTTPEVSSGQFPTGKIAGSVKSEKNVLLNFAKVTAIRTDYNESSVSGHMQNETTNTLGNFEFALREGYYNILISKDGYYPFMIKNVHVTPEETNYIGDVVLNQYIAGIFKNETGGTVRDALDGKSIEGAIVKFRKGWNNYTEKYVTNITGTVISCETDAVGKYCVNLYTGNYTAEVIKDGYIVGHFNMISSPGIPDGQDFVLTPLLDDNQYRIVLTWGSTPKDLDAHLTGELNNERTFHIFYSNKKYSLNGKEIAVLDYDDTSGYGPETVTLTLNMDKSGTYRYSVHDYTNRSSDDSDALSLSGADVKIYTGNTLLTQCSVPTDMKGTVWHVFELVDGELNLLNTMDYESIPSKIE